MPIASRRRGCVVKRVLTPDQRSAIGNGPNDARPKSRGTVKHVLNRRRGPVQRQTRLKQASFVKPEFESLTGNRSFVFQDEFSEPILAGGAQPSTNSCRILQFQRFSVALVETDCSSVDEERRRLLAEKAAIRGVNRCSHGGESHSNRFTAATQRAALAREAMVADSVLLRAPAACAPTHFAVRSCCTAHAVARSGLLPPAGCRKSPHRAFVAELYVERLDVAVLPGTPRLDQQRLWNLNRS